MELRNVLLLSQTAGYIVAFILSLCIIVPMSMYSSDFSGHCLLFSTGEWRETDGQFMVNWANQAYCNYAISVGCLSAIISLIQMYRMSMYLHRATDCTFLFSFLDVVCCVSLSLMTLTAAVMISVGFSRWCDYMTLRFPSCEIAAGVAFDVQDKIDTDGFYFQMGGAQFGAWTSWVCWVGLSVFATLKLVSQHQLRNVRVSMFRERQKLINSANSKSRQGPNSTSSSSESLSSRTTSKQGQTQGDASSDTPTVLIVD